MENEDNEEWRVVFYKGKPTDRLVNKKGEVKKDSGEILLLSDNGAGYLTFGVPSEGTQRRKYIHRAVAEAFIPNPDNLPQVNHIDCNKSNNTVENLDWVTRSQNIIEAHKAGRMVKRTSNGQINKLTEEQVVWLYTAVKRDGVGVGEAARHLGIPRTTASSILNKRSRDSITDVLDKQFKDQHDHQTPLPS